MKSENISLRALEPSDISFLYALENSPDIWQISGTTNPFSQKILEDYINNIQDIYADKQLRLVICKNQNKQPIGTIDLFDFEPKHLRIGIGILIKDTGNRSKGYGKEALQILIEYCKHTLLLKQVYCNILASNTHSLNLFKSVGFIVSGHKKDWIKTQTSWEDELFLQLIF